MKWQIFYESFVTAVHRKTTLTNIEKFNYLLGYLEGQADLAVGLSLTNEHYQIAIDILCERFGDTQLIIAFHMSELLKIKYVKSDKDVVGLRQLHDRMEVNVKSLLSLKVDSKSYGTLLSSIMMERLPHSVNLIINRLFKDKGWICSSFSSL